MGLNSIQMIVMVNYLFGNKNKMKKQTPHKQIKALEAEISRLQQTLPKLELKEFEMTCERINQLEIRRVQLINPIENEAELPTFKILTK